MKVFVNLVYSLHTGVDNILLGFVVDILGVEVLDYDTDVASDSSKDGVQDSRTVCSNKFVDNHNNPP